MALPQTLVFLLVISIKGNRNIMNDIKIIDAVVNIWTEEALSIRPDWGTEFFVEKMKTNKDLMHGLSLDDMLARMKSASIDHSFLIAAKSGRPGLPGCYHMPPEVVAKAVKKHPKISRV